MKWWIVIVTHSTSGAYLGYEILKAESRFLAGKHAVEKLEDKSTGWLIAHAIFGPFNHEPKTG